MIPLEGGVVVPPLYHYKGWELIVEKRKALYVRRVFKHIEDNSYVFLWQILSVICNAVQHWFLYTGGKLYRITYNLLFALSFNFFLISYQGWRLRGASTWL